MSGMLLYTSIYLVLTIRVVSPKNACVFLRKSPINKKNILKCVFAYGKCQVAKKVTCKRNV